MERGQERSGAYSVQEMALPEVSRPAVKNMPNSPASSSSLSGCLVTGSRSRSRCAAIVTSSSAGSPRAFTCWMSVYQNSKHFIARYSTISAPCSAECLLLLPNGGSFWLLLLCQMASHAEERDWIL